jgi:hypothetical protein
LGGPVVDIVANLADGKYTVISMLGSAASPDKMRWLNARAHIYDELREGMVEGKVDLDPDDKTLLDEMLMIQYKFTPKGAIQIESKDDMRSRGVKSPDSLDALTYATADLTHIVNSKYGDKKAGDLVQYDYNILDNQFKFYKDWVW